MKRLMSRAYRKRGHGVMEPVWKDNSDWDVCRKEEVG